MPPTPPTAPTFYVFHGDDDLRIDEEVARMRERMGDPATADLNITEFDGTITPLEEVLGAATSYPFLSDKRLVIVKELLTWITRKGAGNTGKQAVERLVETLPGLPDWTRLVFIERQKLPDNNRIVQLARTNANGLEKAFTVPKDSTGWIVKRAQQEYNTTIEPQAAAALASVTGVDLRRADNELIKLVSYIDEGQPITERDVEVLTPYVAEANLFEMVDALAEGRSQKATVLLHRLLDQQEDALGLFAMIVRQFRLLLLAKEYLASGGYPNEMANALGMHHFVADKLAKQSRGFKLDQLEDIYRSLQDYDVKMKTGRIEPGLALDLLIAGLAR